MDSGSQDRAAALAPHYRHAAGLTQRQLASAAGLSIGVIRDLEQGRTSRLQARSADALARALSLRAARLASSSGPLRTAPGCTADGQPGRLCPGRGPDGGLST